MFNFIAKSKIWFSISLLLFVASLISLSVWGLKLGIDFTGGSLMYLEFKTNQAEFISALDKTLTTSEIKDYTKQISDSNKVIIRFENISEEKHQQILTDLKKELNQEDSFEELRFDAVGSTIGAELKQKAIGATILVLIAIVLFIAFTFRKVSKPVASWKYGVSATIALFHDIVITLGVFAFLGHYYGIEINTSFVAAILTVLGYSVNDTIVVFDRVRENLTKSNKKFDEIVNDSLNQTWARSINTVATVLLTLLAVLFFGGSSIHEFALALIIGVSFGAYSSIFIASPLLVAWEKK